jgi:hypothetical protein
MRTENLRLPGYESLQIARLAPWVLAPPADIRASP